MYILVCYIGHLAISLIATVWVAQTLVRNGGTFLIDAFHGNVELADSINHLAGGRLLSHQCRLRYSGPAHQRPSHEGAKRDRAGVR